MALAKLPSLYEQLNSTPISQDYKVHTFTSTGNTTFAVTGSGDIEYLVVAGAGGGGGGGGGAGGYRTNVSGETSGGGASAEATYGVTAQNYTITVGSGGSGSNAQSGSRGGSGGNSSIVPASGTSIISLGGAGGGVGPQSAITGGSGGGGSYDIATQNGSAGTSGQGFAGGSNGGFTSSPTPAGGGGGSSSVGANAVNSTTSGAGGAGTSSSITGSAVIRAGGGGGGNTRNSGSAGSGGSGGGTSGVLQGSSGSTSASANTGSGSGGGGDQNNGSGGSGIVIIKYVNDGSITATGGTITTISQVSGVSKQRFVETFSGSALDSDRWGIFDGTVTMADYIDANSGGGVLLTSGTALYAGGTFGLGVTSGDTVPTIAPFGNPCTMIYNLRSATVTQPNTHGAGMVGQIRGDMAGNNSALWCERASFTKWKQRNVNSSGSQNDVESTEPYTQDNQNWHNFRLELDASVTKGSIDGVLATTNSTYTPATGVKLTPMFGIQNQGNGSATSLEINYCEVYNR